jgi:protein-tyrosine kinase
VILPTDVDGLSILPAGRHLTNATELLASSRMQAVIARIQTLDPNCIVLFDTPPALLRNESQALVNMVGQVVLVVRAGHTPQDAVLSAIKLAGEGRHVGLVLNQSSDGPDDLYYENGYGKQYGDRA